MNYEHKSSLHTKRIPTEVKVVGIVVVILIILNLIFPKFLSNLFSLIASPFWGGSREEQNINTLSDLENSTIKELQKENEELKSALGANASSSKSLFLAYIVKKPPFSAYDSYIVDIGENKDVKVGDQVFSIKNILLGEILEINNSFAKVKLYSSYGEKYDVFVGEDDIQATAIGQGGGAFEIVLPKEVNVKEGDVVKIPSLYSQVFGIVKRVTVDPARAFSTVLFSQPINIYEEKFVVIHI